MPKCKGCGAEIDWIKTVNGTSMPVDPGYIYIDLSGPKTTTIVTDEGRVVSGSLIDGESLFPVEKKAKGRESHFATCPKAGWFRR